VNKEIEPDSTLSLSPSLYSRTQVSHYNLGSQVTFDCTPQHWYTQYWYDCAFAHQCANLTGLDFRDICDYEFTDDETIYTGHFLDLY